MWVLTVVVQRNYVGRAVQQLAQFTLTTVMTSANNKEEYRIILPLPSLPALLKPRFAYFMRTSNDVTCCNC